LQSQYQQPFANVSFLIAKQWTWKADWNYYSYGEGTPIGPTLPRSFRGNVYTLGVRYAF
jgi:opacity protein-like surface antigen